MYCAIIDQHEKLSIRTGQGNRFMVINQPVVCHQLTAHLIAHKVL